MTKCKKEETGGRERKTKGTTQKNKKEKFWGGFYIVAFIRYVLYFKKKMAQNSP